MKRIVLIEDDAGLQASLPLIFDKALYSVDVYANGVPVLNGSHKTASLYIIDRQLAGADGLDICRFLKSKPTTANVPIIMLSASPNVRPLSLLAGADAMLEKPFKMQELRELVDKLLAE